LRNHLDNIASSSNIAKAMSAKEHLHSYYALKIHGDADIRQ
jgi:hypothetical protein